MSHVLSAQRRLGQAPLAQSNAFALASTSMVAVTLYEVTPLDMAGCSITLTAFDSQMLGLWDDPIRTATLRQ